MKESELLGYKKRKN